MGWKKILKSWTINFNIILGAIVTILAKGFNIYLDEQLVAEIFTLGNILLRVKTDKPLVDK